MVSGLGFAVLGSRACGSGCTSSVSTWGGAIPTWGEHFLASVLHVMRFSMRDLTCFDCFNTGGGQCTDCR